MSFAALRSRGALGGFRASLSPKAAPTAPRRYASTQSSGAGSGFKVLLYGAATAVVAGAGYIYFTDTRSAFHRFVVPPMLRTIFPDAEDAHHAGVSWMKLAYSLGLHTRERGRALSSSDEPSLAVRVYDTKLDNPIGISAGLDKDAAIPDALFALGAGIVEVGGCTPKPQPGNERPRCWRTPTIDGMVNCYGLNSLGADAMARTLRERVRIYARSHGITEEDVLSGRAGVPVGSLLPGRLLCVQVAKNKDTSEQDAASDYAFCASRLARYADVIVVNVSSPNTAGLRDLQSGDKLVGLLGAVVRAVETSTKGVRATPPKVMVKVSPDEDDESQVKDIVRAVWESGVDGVIVGNTTKRKLEAVPAGVAITNKEKSILMMPDGGFSGPSMYNRTLELVKRYRKWIDVPAFKDKERKVIFASGGLTNGKEALELQNAGADVAMLYTNLVYGGAGTVTRIKDEMKNEIKGVKKE